MAMWNDLFWDRAPMGATKLGRRRSLIIWRRWAVGAGDTTTSWARQLTSPCTRTENFSQKRTSSCARIDATKLGSLDLGG